MDQLTKAWVRLSTLATPTEKKNDTGAGIVEYAAILILVAAVAAGIWALGIPTLITDAIDVSIDDILSGPE